MIEKGVELMQNMNFGDKLQVLRKDLNMTQKEFSEHLKIPQPSLSAYENNRNSPTMEVLINIAQTCNVSLDWLCGLSSTKHSISTLGDVADFLYMLLEVNELKLEIDIHDKLPNDLETEDEKWYTSIKVYGNDPEFSQNADFCNLLRHVVNDYMDLETYSISKDIYDIAKEKTKNNYNLPLTQKKFPELSREERMKKQMEYLKALALGEIT